MRDLNIQDVKDIIMGCTVLGTGGGGDPAIGLSLLEEDFKAGRKFTLVGLDEMPDDEYIASPYVCGSISPESQEEIEKYKDLPVMDQPTPVIAYQKLQEYMNRPFYGVISTELGGANTAYTLHIGAMLGKKIIDGDFAGRSVPAVQHNTCNIFDIPMTPFAIATKFGDSAIFTNIVDEQRAEALIRALSVESQNNIGVVDHPATGATLRHCVVPQAITTALQVGRILREEVSSGKDPTDRLVEEMNGKDLFHGIVTAASWDTVGGYTEGDVFLYGTEHNVGEEYHIWFQNENIISWRNGNIDVTVPDLICVLDDKGVPVTNPNCFPGQKLRIFALPAPVLWTTKKGLELFGPKSFGFDIEYEGIHERRT